MLFEKHAVVHLKNGPIWTTLEELSDHHSDDLLKCDIHLCYLGQGLFIELIERDIPLQILPKSDTEVQSLIIENFHMMKNQCLIKYYIRV